MGVETRKVGDDEAGMRLDRWFRSHFPALPFGHLQKLLRTGQVRVDGARVKTNTRLAPGQRVRVPPLSKKPPSGREGSAGETGRSDVAEAAASSPSGRPHSRAVGAAARGKEQGDADFLRSITLYEDREVLVLNKP